MDPARSSALLAALGESGELRAGDLMPPLFHWLHFWDPQPPARIGPDGHPARGGFLPPVSGPRRMWAGGELQFVQPLRLGEPARRISTIAAIDAKTGRSGPLTFVTINHELHGPSGLVLKERQDLVFRGPEKPSVAAPPPAPEPQSGDWRESVLPDAVLLFRYSALTLNSHRIHYDQPYATAEEGYRDLVVQGPLQATLMLRAAMRAQDGAPRAFRFRAISPAFAGAPLSLKGWREGEGALWVEQDDRRTLEGRATFEADG